MTITVTAKDEDPVFTMGKLSHEYKENGTDAVYTFAAYDPEGGDVTYSLSGDDAEQVHNHRWRLHLQAAEPNFEKPGDANGDNVYEVTVKAAATSGLATEKITTLAVMVEVTNVDDPGTVSLSATQPRIGVAITANDLRDEDGMVSDVTWQWSRADAVTFDTSANVTEIKGATMASYTPVGSRRRRVPEGNGEVHRRPRGWEDHGCYIGPSGGQKARNLAPVVYGRATQQKTVLVSKWRTGKCLRMLPARDSVGAPVVASGDAVDADDTDDAAIVYR